MLKCRGFLNLNIIGFLVLISGCQTSSKETTSREKVPPLNIIAIDRSGSTQHMREAQIATLRAAFARAAKWGEVAAIYTVDRKTACVMAPAILKRGQSPPSSVLREMQTSNPERATRTRPALFWEEMVKEYATAKDGRLIRILYLTDGGNDWLEEDTRVSKAANELARNPNVYVALLGLHTDLYAPIQKQFSTFNEKNAVFSIGSDREMMIQGLSALREKGEE